MPQTMTKQETTAKQSRMANLELLRCVAMMMVIVLHYLGKGGLLADLTGENLSCGEMTAWLLECFCIVAVNVYMFISGYFLSMSSFKLSRLIQLWLQVWVYSVAFGLAGALSGAMTGVDFDAHYLLTLIFPISMGHYWFMTAYVFLYLLFPFLGMAVQRMTRQQLKTAAGLLLFTFCILKSALPVRLEMDGQGYDCLWYICVFMAAAYVRRFGIRILQKKRTGAAMYAGCCLLAFGGTLLLRFFYLRTGSMGRMIQMCLDYNHVLPFLASVGLFCFFSNIHVGGHWEKIISRVAPYTLGVYLLHENLGLRYAWQKWLGADQAAEAMAEGGILASGRLVLWVVLAVICVFACGILADVVRKWFFGIIHRGLLHTGPYRRLVVSVQKTDEYFQIKKNL